MNYRIVRYAASMLIALPLMTLQRVLALAKIAPRVSQKSLTRRTFYWAASELREMIGTAKFKLSDTEKIISKLPLPTTKGDGCKVSGLIEHIVFKATEHKSEEKKYAAVLNQLHNHGWSKGSCCIQTMVHSSVISNLPFVTQQLLKQNPQWAHATDMHNCVPIDYAQSPVIIYMLKECGSRDAQLYTGEDRWYRVPDHGWQQVTPLRKAVYDGDVEKYSKLAQQIQLSQDEGTILHALAALRFWRTGDPKFLKINAAIVILQTDDCFRN